jgi:phosphoribosylanthranilate isomerase
MASTPDFPFIIKICGITNEEDARTAVAAGANALGFNFYPKSPRYITPERAQQIIAAIPGPYVRVGVFVNATEEELLETAHAVRLDVFQLHGDRCPRSFAQPLRIWRSIAPTAPTDNPDVEAYLLDTPSPDYGGSGETFDWKLAQAHTSRVILAGGLDASNVAEAIRIAKPWGVDACSRLESSPGKKDAEAVRGFVTAAQASEPKNTVGAGYTRPAPRQRPKEANL